MTIVFLIQQSILFSSPVREPSPVVSQEPEYNEEETADLKTRVQKLEDELRRVSRFKTKCQKKQNKVLCQGRIP